MTFTQRFKQNQGIVPPHLLDAILQSSHTDPTAKHAALQTLSVSDQWRQQRLASAPTLLSAKFLALSGLPRKNRSTHSAEHKTSLPGKLVRSEGEAPSRDSEVDQCYEGLGATFDLFQQAFGRNSIDNQGMDLVGTVHFSRLFNNAFWNGEQMVFGDGDGVYFNSFTVSIDVMGHELTHGVIASTAELEYSGQSGALNESIADVFGSLVKQFYLKQQAGEADWLIGAGMFTKKVRGTALRSMKSPGSAYDDPVLGKDPQPGHMNQFLHTTEDNGGVHINSGIPNHAFYHLALSLGGHAWEKAGALWYAALCDDRLESQAQFQDFAALTVDNASRLFGDSVKQATLQAWDQVGIRP